MLRKRLCLLGVPSDSFSQYLAPLMPRTNGGEKQGNVASIKASAWTSIWKLEMLVPDALE